MNDFECLSYMSYIYTRKHHKEDNLGWEISFRKSSVRGSSSRWKDTFAIDDKGGEIYLLDAKVNAWRKSTKAWFQGEHE
jgi:hypothetical protein